MNSLFVAWRPPQPDDIGWRPVGRLTHDGGLYRFSYTAGARKPGFQPFPGMAELDQVYESERLFPIFENRLLPRNRPEYASFLQWSGFDSGSPPSPLVVLGVTEGRKETDAIEVFPCPVIDQFGLYSNRFFLHGIRWLPVDAQSRVNRLKPGEPLKLMLDIQNSVDQGAVAVRTEVDRMMIGYVPRYLARDAHQLSGDCLAGSLELSVSQLNRDAPMQNRVLVQMRARWPSSFVPCSGEDFQPIADSVAGHL